MSSLFMFSLNNKIEIFKNNTNYRVEWIDYFRFFGVLLMVMGHIGFGSKFDVWIHGFHMPMFFFISGVLYKEIEKQEKIGERLKKTIIKKAKVLLIPYLCVGIMSYILWIIKHFASPDLLSPLYHLLMDNSNGLPYTGALWFLTSFFFTSIIYAVIDVITLNCKLRVAWKTLISVAFAIIGCTLSYRLPWSLNAAFVGVGLMHFGWLLRNCLLKEHSVVSWGGIVIALLALLALSMVIFLNGSINMRTGTYHNIGMFWIGAVGSSIVVCYIAKLVYGFINLHKSLSVCGRYFCSVGRNSMTYLCFNQLTILGIKNFLAMSDKGNNSTLEKLIMSLMALLLAFVVLYIISLVVENFKVVRIIIGFDTMDRYSWIVIVVWLIFLCIMLFACYILRKFKF